MGEEGVPQWITYLAGAVGVMIASFVMRMGWKSGGGEKPSHIATSDKPQIVGAVIDDSSIIMLSASVGALVTTLREIDSRASKGGEARAEILTKMMQAVSSLAVSVDRFVKDREEEEEKREQREREELKRENERLERELKEAQRRSNESRRP